MRHTLILEDSSSPLGTQLSTQQTLQCCTIFCGACYVISGVMHGHRPTSAPLLLSQEYPWQAGGCVGSLAGRYEYSEIL